MIKILETLNADNKPVNLASNVKLNLQANQILDKDFQGELSSLTGIQSKGLYIAKINQITCEPERPTITIISEHYIHIEKDGI